MTAIAIIDRSPVFAFGLAQIFAGEGYATSTAHRSCFPYLLGKVDVIVLDCDRAEASGVEHLCDDALPFPPVLHTTVIAALVGRMPAKTRSPRAFSTIERDAPPEHFLEAVWSLVHPSCDAEEAASAVPSDKAALLSNREHEVLRQIARGLTHGQVARQLDISQHTVNTYVRRIRTKLSVGNKAELTRAALAIATQPSWGVCGWCG